MKKQQVLSVIDNVMNNTKYNSIRGAILAIREQILKIPDDDDNKYFMKDYYAKLKLRGDNPLYIVEPYFEGAKYVCIDTMAKLDTGCYGTICYTNEED